MVDKVTEGILTSYFNNNVVVERVMKKSKAGKHYPSLSIRRTYTTEGGTLKRTEGFYPSDIKDLIQILPEVEKDNQQYIFKSKIK